MSKTTNTQKGGEFNQEYADIVCEAIATSSRGVTAICRANREKDPSFPSKTTVFAWLATNEAFAEQYTRAKKAQAELLVDELLEIADERAFDTTENNDGMLVPDHEYMQRSRLRIDTRKWIACKLIPRVYGDKVQTEHSGGITVKKHEEALNELT